MEAEISYKRRHEEFVSGLTGGDISEVYAVTIAAVSGCVVWGALQTRARYFANPYSVTALLADFGLNWLAILLSTTAYSSSPLLFNVLLLTPAVLAIAAGKPSARRAPPQKAGGSGKSDDYLTRKPHLTWYRGGMMVATCLSILAVDFQEFPRRFAKVETWGTSLMDLGVGSFVFSMGLVSSRGALKDKYAGTTPPLLSRLARSGRMSAAVLLLGVIRLLAVKSVDYHEHVSEYGTHWNFFITLGLLPLFDPIFDSIATYIPTGVCALAVSAAYEVALSHTGLLEFVLTAPRVGLISQNKEGIFSMAGYIAIFLAGKGTGYYVLPRAVSTRGILFPQPKNAVPATTDSNYKVLGTLIVSSLTHLVLFYVANSAIPVSRRLANLPYVLWIISYNTAYLGMYLLAYTLIFPKGANYNDAVPLSLESVNANGLLIFLVANMGTGLINLNFNTLDASRAQTLAILVAYAGVLYTIAWNLYRRRIFVKF